MTIRLATPADGKTIKELMKKVFADDPLMVWFLLQDHRREAALEAFYRFAVEKYCLPHGLCWVSLDEKTAPEITGAALWMPPGKWELPVFKQFSMVGVIVRSFGWKNVFLKFNERQKIDKCHPKKPPHYYLSGLGVSEELRGKGIGSALLKPMLERCDREGAGCYLETSLERNLKFYERHGFKITQQLGIGPDRFPLWLMWRDPPKD